MSKKHFIALAETLAGHKPPQDSSMEFYNFWVRIVSGIAHVCSVHGPNFHRQTFLTACGYREDEAQEREDRFRQVRR